MSSRPRTPTRNRSTRASRRNCRMLVSQSKTQFETLLRHSLEEVTVAVSTTSYLRCIRMRSQCTARKNKGATARNRNVLNCIASVSRRSCIVREIAIVIVVVIAQRMSRSITRPSCRHWHATRTVLKKNRHSIIRNRKGSV